MRNLFSVIFHTTQHTTQPHQPLCSSGALFAQEAPPTPRVTNGTYDTHLSIDLYITIFDQTSLRVYRGVYIIIKTNFSNLPTERTEGDGEWEWVRERERREEIIIKEKKTNTHVRLVLFILSLFNFTYLYCYISVIKMTKRLSSTPPRCTLPLAAAVAAAAAAAAAAPPAAKWRPMTSPIVYLERMTLSRSGANGIENKFVHHTHALCVFIYLFNNIKLFIIFIFLVYKI